MEINDIIKLIEAVSKNDLTSFEYDNGEDVLVLKKKKEVTQMVVSSAPAVTERTDIVQMNTVTAKSETPGNIEFDQVVTSPLVGIFYSSPSPDADSFVQVGDHVKKGQVLGIIEAMKLMNEIESEFDGVVEAILINNEDLVEYGQPLFRIR